ncbi:urease accessory protein F-like isoform X1 [Varroa jacobsoni]|uniref:Urease accessory protein UreF n=2 Tax=Varroa TaxID=62624 RepID=A0A7M7IXP4_VARDE|nr:urease accessory protein F-like isoform X1 [Varroa destructor]XP_022687367.1 urease accessory protein F-like isoform X1 [Varroa jacobsoni]
MTRRIVLCEMKQVPQTTVVSAATLDSPASATIVREPRLVFLNLLQICDSALPISGFTHSGGIEAAWRRGAIPTIDHLQRFLKICIIATCSQQVPYVAAAYAALTSPQAEPDSTAPAFNLQANSTDVDGDIPECIRRLTKLDRLLSVSLSNHVARRASLQQGRTLLSLAIEVFPSTAPLHRLEMLRVNSAVRLSDHDSDEKAASFTPPSGVNFVEGPNQRRLARFEGHLAVVFGAVCALLGAQLSETLDAFAFSTLRNSLSAAIRLGRIGPVQAQTLQHSLSDFCVRAVERYSQQRCGEEDHQASPTVDLYQNSQDRLFTKMFYS